MIVDRWMHDGWRIEGGNSFSNDCVKYLRYMVKSWQCFAQL